MPVEFSAEPDSRTSVLSFPLGVYSFLKWSKTGRRLILVWLPFSISTHQNDLKPIGSVPAYRPQCTLAAHPIYQTLLFDFLRVWLQDYGKERWATAWTWMKPDCNWDDNPWVKSTFSFILQWINMKHWRFPEMWQHFRQPQLGCSVALNGTQNLMMKKSKMP